MRVARRTPHNVSRQCNNKPTDSNAKTKAIAIMFNRVNQLLAYALYLSLGHSEMFLWSCFGSISITGSRSQQDRPSVNEKIKASMAGQA